MPMHVKLFLILGALSAAVTVILGAAAAHTLGGLPAGAQAWFHTALQYHQFHALGLVGVGLIAAQLPASRAVITAGVLMVFGMLLFSGNLYLRSLVDFHAFHAVTPFGGAAYILSWLALAAGVLADREGAR